MLKNLFSEVSNVYGIVKINRKAKELTRQWKVWTEIHDAGLMDTSDPEAVQHCVDYYNSKASLLLDELNDRIEKLRKNR